EAVEVIFRDPLSRVGEEEVAHWSAVRIFEVERLAPIVGVAVGEVVIGKLFQVVAVRAEMVVDHVENDAETERVGAVDEAAQVVRIAIEMVGSEEADAVVAPAEGAGE